MMAFNEQLHPRGTGAQGGQFAVSGGGGSTTQQSSLSFNGKTGSGYGAKGGDSNVKALQGQLNRLGVKDANGQPLKLDGKLGPKTTAAIKRLQRHLGLPADGKVTPAFLRQIKSLKVGSHVKHTTHQAHQHRQHTAHQAHVAHQHHQHQAHQAHVAHQAHTGHTTATPRKPAPPARRVPPGKAGMGSKPPAATYPRKAN